MIDGNLEISHVYPVVGFPSRIILILAPVLNCTVLPKSAMVKLAGAPQPLIMKENKSKTMHFLIIV